MLIMFTHWSDVYMVFLCVQKKKKLNNVCSPRFTKKVLHLLNKERLSACSQVCNFIKVGIVGQPGWQHLYPLGEEALLHHTGIMVRTQHVLPRHHPLKWSCTCAVRHAHQHKIYTQWCIAMETQPYLPLSPIFCWWGLICNSTCRQ